MDSDEQWLDWLFPRYHDAGIVYRDIGRLEQFKHASDMRSAIATFASSAHSEQSALPFLRKKVEVGGTNEYWKHRRADFAVGGSHDPVPLLDGVLPPSAQPWTPDSRFADWVGELG